jgi:hypothetical protein
MVDPRYPKLACIKLRGPESFIPKLPGYLQDMLGPGWTTDPLPPASRTHDQPIVIQRWLERES